MHPYRDNAQFINDLGPCSTPLFLLVLRRLIGEGGGKWYKEECSSRARGIEISIMVLLFTGHGILGKFLSLAEP